MRHILGVLEGVSSSVPVVAECLFEFAFDGRSDGEETASQNSADFYNEILVQAIPQLGGSAQFIFGTTLGDVSQKPRHRIICRPAARSTKHKDTCEERRGRPPKSSR